MLASKSDPNERSLMRVSINEPGTELKIECPELVPSNTCPRMGINPQRAEFQGTINHAAVCKWWRIDRKIVSVISEVFFKWE
jgi:hypothetical protein